MKEELAGLKVGTISKVQQSVFYKSPCLDLLYFSHSFYPEIISQDLTLKQSPSSQIIGNTQHPGMPIFVSTPGSPPTPPNTNDVSILDLPVPPVEETLIPIPVSLVYF